MFVRAVARPLLASIFVTGGLNTLRNPQRVVPLVAPSLQPLTKLIPGSLGEKLRKDPSPLVRVNSGVQLVGGALIAVGRGGRWAPLAVAASMVPTTVVGHAFWKQEDEKAKAAQRIQFLKNAGLIGGLLLASTES